MRQGNIFLLILALIIITAVITSVGLTGRLEALSVRAQEGNPERTKKWQTLTPVDEAQVPADTHERTLRQSKSRRYNSTRSDQVLTEQPSDGIYGRIDESQRPSAIPTSLSDAVILGTIVSAQPYLADDKKSVYTEFTVRVEEAFKQEVPSHMTTGNLMVVDQEGGALRLKDGRLLRYLVGGTSRLPSVNGRFVLFLFLIHNGQDLSILSGYELRNGRVVSLEDGGVKSPYANWDEWSFLSVLRNAVKQGSPSLSETQGAKR